MYLNLSTIIERLSTPIPFFGIELWIAILTCIVLFILVCITTLCIIITRQRKALKPMVSKDVRINSHNNSYSMGMRSIPEKQVMFSTSRATRPSYQFKLIEIQAVTNDFADENVVACGDYAIVYHGIMFGNTRVSIKRLLSSRNIRTKAKEFTGEVEVLLGLRHKNLVKLLGYCFEGNYRIIVEEYVNNGNLGQWLHDCISEVSPLTWNIRMNIVLGIAKGLAYLHEDTEPAAIIHQHLNSTSILLDKYWHPKISDFGITNILDSDERSNHPITPPPGMSGYLAPEYFSTGNLDDKSDVYSFGILIMEIVSGKPPIYTITENEEYLIDWMKSMVASQQYDQIVDPKLPENPSMKELKIILLVALRCVDPDVNNRPKMGQVIHMLQPESFCP